MSGQVVNIKVGCAQCFPFLENFRLGKIGVAGGMRQCGRDCACPEKTYGNKKVGSMRNTVSNQFLFSLSLSCSANTLAELPFGWRVNLS